MNIELLLKVLGFLGVAIAGAIGTWKVIVELLRANKQQLRDDFHFARAFLSDGQTQKMTPLVRELGYQAIAGDTRVSGEEVAYVLSLFNAGASVKSYVFSRRLLEFFSTAQSGKIRFKAPYASSIKRQSMRRFYVLSYGLTYTLSFLPLLLISLRLQPLPEGMAQFVFTSLVFFPLALLSLRAAARLRNAETLVAAQRTMSV
jgi:hypothetical protein